MSPCSSSPPNPLTLNVFIRKRIKKTKAPMRPQSSRPSFVTPPLQKYKSMKEILKVAKRCEIVEEDWRDGGDVMDVRCGKCEGGDRGDEMLLCDKCNGGFHMFCLSPIVVRVPIGEWFCPNCEQKKTVGSFPLLQTKIVDFFRIEKCIELNPEKCSSLQDSRKRRRRSEPLVIYKRRRRMLPFNPTQDDERRLEQMGSLATALTALHMEFSNDLTYMSGMAPKSANQAILEHGGMQGLSKEDKETLEQCRAMWKRGEWPPLVVVFDTREGYTVEADSLIKDMTLISEYTGDVDFIENRENDDCDSMMTLLSATDSSKSLVICPDRRGNIARFINGINNHTPEGRKKQNLKCVRYNVNGECRVLLVAIRDIAKGERLYYDYNGYEYAYPTYHFV